ncbi:hypothetical protein ACIQCR_17195 [Streptomyces sp. NPDC093249]|uniref:hypothetical protein n=1 Tax=unclassified Streptomyces TaxID=2593676 RepID=UPI003450C56E
MSKLLLLPAARAVTQGERELRDWHRNLRLGAAGAGFGMMTASLYQLHWAGTLVGFPTVAAGTMAISLEILLAFNAGVVTSIRRRDADGNETGYYWSLWLIFGFLLTISIAANVGHAVVAMGAWLGSGEAPRVLVENPAWVYGIGSAVAAMVPLGGSFGLHISGFVRAHGAGSDWVDPDGTRVLAEESADSDLSGEAGEGDDGAESGDTVPGPGDEKGPRTPPLTEEELYRIYKVARDKGQARRFGKLGDLCPSQLGRRLGQSPQNGRKTVGPRFDARYRAERLAEEGGGVDMKELADTTAPSS